MSNTPQGIFLSNPPEDSISCVKFAPSPNYLCTTAWDGTTRLYDHLNNQVCSEILSPAPILDVSFGESTSVAYIASIDGSVTRCDFSRPEDVQQIGMHTGGVTNVRFDATSNGIYSCGWDGKVRVWDDRQSVKNRSETNETVISLDPVSKSQSMSLHSDSHKLLVAGSNRLVFVFDTRNMNSPFSVRQSSLTNETRKIEISPDGACFATSSVDGRVSIKTFQSDSSNAGFVFKSNRKLLNGNMTAFPVNGLAFHPITSTLLTAGSDGVANIWDISTRKRVSSILLSSPDAATSSHLFPNSTLHLPEAVSSVDFSSDGVYLAFATSYSWELGAPAVDMNVLSTAMKKSVAVHVRAPEDHLVRPKSVRK